LSENVGTVFKHVDDKALRSLEGSQCHYCERSDVPVYSYFGVIVNPTSAANVELATEEPEVDELCAECINSGKIERRDRFAAEQIIPRFAKESEQAWEEVHRLPEVPLFLQGFDWPMCCGIWTDFTGSPPDSR